MTHQLPYILQFVTHTNTGPETFSVRNAFDNIKIELYPGNKLMKPVININGKSNFFPENNFLTEQNFYQQARHNYAIDNRYQNVNPHSILTGSSVVAGNFAYDSHIRITQYDPYVSNLITELKAGKITQAQYAYMRWQAQIANKKQLSVIGQNLSEFPPFGKSAAAQKATAEKIMSGEKKINVSSMHTRKLTDTSAKIFRGVGAGIVVLSVAQSVHEVWKSSDKVGTATKEAGGWAGSLAGGEIGMHAGAEIGGSIGLFFCGAGFAPGAAIGGFIGGIAGGIGGYVWGHKVAEEVMAPRKSNSGFKGFGGGSFGGGGASGSW